MTKHAAGLIIGCSLLFSSCISADQLTGFSDPYFPRYVKLDLANSPAEPNKQTIKIVSYNIDLCKKVEKVERFLEENKFLANADIVCLQEMNLKGLKFLAHKLKYNYVYYPSAIHPGNQKDFGQAILSRWPIEKDQKVLLPFSSQDRYLKLQRCAVGAVILVNTQKIHVFSAHLGVMISPEHRKKQVRAIIAAIPPTAEKCIIAGDFNTYAQIHIRAIMQALEEGNFKLATKNTGWTYKYWYLFNRKSALDYIFYKGLNLIRAGKITNRSFSDHLPIWADFEY
ncbi:MAG TPA: endonuclease/exonuclease/phosphatase family protein [Candidatus Omnitrophota bacterium]|nr:endonuclease/exonuclease/phosphatase family protein [Candidatus Omnitrophota bacterium]HPT39550.1 endonuclease/exonuclease/phosphatase family protein [Candidatus Omnitrophota bacterium]